MAFTVLLFSHRLNEVSSKRRGGRTILASCKRDVVRYRDKPKRELYITYTDTLDSCTTNFDSLIYAK